MVRNIKWTSINIYGSKQSLWPESNMIAIRLTILD